MQDIIEVKQSWPKDYFKIDLYVGNICNFQCWYCWPEFHEGNIKWPDYELLVGNVSHLLDYYIEHTDKKKFQIAMLGGEIVHWKHFVDFIKHFKENYDCIFTIQTNASKNLAWWEATAPYLDAVNISHHDEFSKVSHNRDVADYLYEKNVIVNIQVMMDPRRWNACMNAVEYYKNSKHQWTIRHSEIVHADITYTVEQKLVLQTLRPRTSSPEFYFRNNKSPTSEVTVVDSTGNQYRIADHILVLERLNNFKGWQCDVGVDWINIRADGTISGICGNKLYDQSVVYNIFDKKFNEIFRPKITSTVCYTDCWCTFETNMPKRKLATTKNLHRSIQILISK